MVDYSLRKLKSPDMFVMFKILSKIGFKDLKNSFSPETINDVVSAFNGEESDEFKTTFVGFSVIMEIVEVIMKNLPCCEKEIYMFLSNLSGMSESDISELDIATFTEMIVAVIKKEEFKDFFKVVSGLFN